jgi:hypothetical protein
MLAVSHGRLILMSTPFGRRGHFFEAWEQQRGWKKIAITADQCPRITPEFLAEERETLGEWMFRQEYQGVFTETLDQLFTFESIQTAFDHDVPPLFDIPEEGLIWTSDFTPAST